MDKKISVEQALQLAVQHHNAGRLSEAETLYKKVLGSNPNQPDALHLLGVIASQAGHNDIALDLITQSLVISPNCAEAHNNLGKILKEQGKLDEAISSYHKALAINPQYVEANYNLGNALMELWKFNDAAASYQKALAINPSYAGAHCNFGRVLLSLGKLDGAVTSFQKALTIKPDFAEAWGGLKVATKARRFLRSQKSQTDVPCGEGLSAVARATTSYAMLEYSLDSFKPHKADESFKKAMAALPPRIGEEVARQGAQGERADPPLLPDKIVALLHFARSGTGLFHSLIDDHPEISTLPSIYLSGFFNPDSWRKIATAGWRGLPERFADEYAVLFDANATRPIVNAQGKKLPRIGESEGMTCVGEDRSEALSVDRDAFCVEVRRLMEGLGKVDPRSFLLVVHAAYERALATRKTKETVFYHIHNPDEFATLNFLRYAPDARLVMMVREPIQSCESWIRVSFQENNYSQIVIHIIEMLYAIDQVPFRTQESVGIRLEDLKRRPKETMRSICAWLSIQETLSLYEMTAQGKKWWGDPSSPDYANDTAMSPFDDVATKRPVGAIFSEKDQLVLRTLFYPFSVRFGYRDADPEQFQKDLKAIRPLLDDLLDFERTLADRLNTDPSEFKRNGMYQYFRAGLVDRWDVLDELGDYPRMLEPLAIG
jgi:tetratricopeptide (TPR) repeat protein